MIVQRRHQKIISLVGIGNMVVNKQSTTISIVQKRIVLLLLVAAISSCNAFAPPTTNNYVLSRASLSTTTSLSVAIDTSDIKNGLTVELDGEPYKVLNFSIMKQARGAAKTTIKFKNLKRGNTIENTYRSGEKFETAQIDRKPSQYTYEDEVRVFVMCSLNCIYDDCIQVDCIQVLWWDRYRVNSFAI